MEFAKIILLLGLQSTTVNLTIFLHVMESYLTMNHHVEEKLSFTRKITRAAAAIHLGTTR